MNELYDWRHPMTHLANMTDASPGLSRKIYNIFRKKNYFHKETRGLCHYVYYWYA